MKHIYAVVKLPIEITSDGSYNILSERISTTIEPCDELPPINEDQASGIIEQIQSIMSSNTATDVEIHHENESTENSVVSDIEHDPTTVKLVLDDKDNINDNQNKMRKMTFRNKSRMKHNNTKKVHNY